MKKVWIVFLVPVLLLAGLFFWKGGHHAMVVSEAWEEWLDLDAADQSLTIQVQNGSFSADTFWTEYGDDKVYGLTAGGMTAYLRRGILYMDTGKAYALPELPELKASAGRLAMGLLLHGRMSRNGNIYHLTMETEELDLRASFTVDRTIQTMTVTAVLPDGNAISATLTSMAPKPHPIEQAVADAMVLAKMERPMSLSEPLEAVLPALQNLLPLSGSLELGLSSGVLELSETVELTIADKRVSLSRSGVQADLSLDLSSLSPAALGLVALRNGTFSRDGDTTVIHLSIPGSAAAQLTQMLVPQAAGLDVTFEDSTLVLTISGSRLTHASVHARGSLPFLFSTIPLTFTADLRVQ